VYTYRRQLTVLFDIFRYYYFHPVMAPARPKLKRRKTIINLTVTSAVPNNPEPNCNDNNDKTPRRHSNIALPPSVLTNNVADEHPPDGSSHVTTTNSIVEKGTRKSHRKRKKRAYSSDNSSSSDTSSYAPIYNNNNNQSSDPPRISTRKNLKEYNVDEEHPVVVPLPDRTIIEQLILEAHDSNIPIITCLHFDPDKEIKYPWAHFCRNCNDFKLYLLHDKHTTDISCRRPSRYLCNAGHIHPDMPTVMKDIKAYCKNQYTKARSHTHDTITNNSCVTVVTALPIPEGPIFDSNTTSPVVAASRFL
jgi:hypothetical protein